jgi:ABC-type uncharacterized transport system involved in gliding motility auxiliary subunit
MNKLGQVVGICGSVALLSTPLTLFLWDWHVTWGVIVKVVFGGLAVGFWVVVNRKNFGQVYVERSVFYSCMSGVFVAIGVCFLFVVNYYFTISPHRFDLTEERVHSLNQKTLSLLEGLDSMLEVGAFYGSQDPDYRYANTAFLPYRYASDKFVVDFVDPALRPDLVKEYKVNLSGKRIVMKYKNRQVKVALRSRRHSGSEETITTAMFRLINPQPVGRICFCTGHQEKDIASGDSPSGLSFWRSDLQSEGYQTESFPWVEPQRIPQACRVLVIVGAQWDYSPVHVAALSRFLTQGGRLMVFVGAMDSDSIAPLLLTYGVLLGADVVVNPKNKMPFNVLSDPLRYPTGHAIFSQHSDSSSGFRALFPLARSVTTQKVEGVKGVQLVLSKEDFWAKRGSSLDLASIAFDPEKDTPGPVPLAVAVESSLPGKESPVLAVFGSAMLVTNSMYQRVPFNRDLVMNTLAWLVHREKQISIRPRYRASSLVLLDDHQLKLVTFFVFDFLPLLVLALGLSIWRTRRWS